MVIDFESSESVVLTNPREPNLPKSLQELKKLYDNHFWLLTSGTSGRLKAVALSKEALFSSAKAVNERMEVSSKDVWLNPLPLFHVGGLGIEARAYLTKSNVIHLEKWDPSLFAHLCEKSHLTSLVPTQISDLVSKRLQAPKQLKAVFVGGGALSKTLFQEAKALGWPLYITYGMTECASQIATSFLNETALRPLPHLLLKISEEGKICIKGASLFTTCAFIESRKVTLSDCKKEGWFETEDFGELRGDVLELFGRSSDYIKINGEGLYLSALEEVLQSVCLNNNVMLVALPCERRGSQIVIVCEGERFKGIEGVVEEYNKRVLPVAKIVDILVVPQFPRTFLGKIKKDLFYNKETMQTILRDQGG